MWLQEGERSTVVQYQNAQTRETCPSIDREEKEEKEKRDLRWGIEAG